MKKQKTPLRCDITKKIFAPRGLTLCIKIFVCLGLVFAVVLCSCNITVLLSAERYRLDFYEATELRADCIIVLGAGLDKEGNPSVVLRDRLETAYRLFEKGASDRLLVSGDHGSENYDESNAMKDFLAKKGVDRDVIFADHAGFSTYDTMYRAREVFEAKRVIIVTQDFHLSRAVYIARALGLEAYGVSADSSRYSAKVLYELRETAARGAYLLKAIFKPKPTYLGPAIPLSGSGSATDG